MTRQTLNNNRQNFLSRRINDVFYEIHRVELSLKKDIKDTRKDIEELKVETTNRLDKIEQLLIEALKSK